MKSQILVPEIFEGFLSYTLCHAIWNKTQGGVCIGTNLSKKKRKKQSLPWGAFDRVKILLKKKERINVGGRAQSSVKKIKKD
jgi:hypothetical protein